MNDDKIAQLQQREHELRDNLRDVQETVLDLNNEEASLRRSRDDIRSRLMTTEKQRHELERAEEDRRKRLGKDHPSLKRGEAAEALQTQRVTLDHARALLKATEEKLDADLTELDERRRPFVQSQRRMVHEIDKCVKRQHQLHLDPTLPLQEPANMQPSSTDPFRQAAAPKSQQPADPAQKPLMSTQRLDELKQQLDKPAPAPQLNPPGMSPDVGKHVRDNKAIGDEILRIQKAIANRRGQARDSFKRSSGG
jgi:chromosome segregation ATPase